jgi:hypothetical protein
MVSRFYVGWARLINLAMLILSFIALAHLTVTGAFITSAAKSYFNS